MEDRYCVAFLQWALPRLHLRWAGAVAGAHELADRIESALITLPERERRAFVMRKLCGLSFEEIAEELGRGGAASARKLYSRLLAQLSSRLPDLTGP